MRIAFVWQGVTERFSHWNDGLRQAMRIIEKTHDVTYYEPTDNIDADVVLYWEAPCTINGQHAQNYRRIQELQIPKALLFAGGTLVDAGLWGFNLFFTESAINDDEFRAKGLPYKRAFGVNDTVFKPIKQTKKYDAIHHGTCASWKRQGLLCTAIKSKALVVGQHQQSDPEPFNICQAMGSTVMGEQNYETVNKLLNQSRCLVNTADFWGGGQRATLEAMAVGIPVVVMEDSPKNREYVEESGCGIICKPEPLAIQKAVEDAKKIGYTQKSVDYIKSKWTAQHYADSLLEGIQEICSMK